VDASKSIVVSERMLEAGIDALRSQDELLSKPSLLLRDTAAEVYAAMQSACLAEVAQSLGHQRKRSAVEDRS
jgi:hypothetical protein